MGKYNFLSSTYGLNEIRYGSYTGNIKGFNTVIIEYPYDNILDIRMGIDRKNKENDDIIINFIKSKYDMQAEILDSSLIVEVPFDSQENMKEIVCKLIDELTINLSSLGYKTGSFISGEDDGTVEMVNIGGYILYATESEYDQMSRNFERKRQLEKERMNIEENVLMGIIGIIIAGIVGMAAHILAVKAGFYAIGVPFGMVLGSMYLYQKFAGILTIKAFLYMLIILVFFLTFALVFEYALDFYDLAKNEYSITLIEALIKVPGLIAKTEELRFQFLKDYTLNLVVLIGYLGSIYFETKREMFRG